MLNTLVPTFLIYKLKRLGSTGNKNIQGKEWMLYMFSIFYSPGNDVYKRFCPPLLPKKKEKIDVIFSFLFFFFFSKVSINCSIQCYSIKLFHISKSMLVCSYQLELIFFFWGEFLLVFVELLMHGISLIY